MNWEPLFLSFKLAFATTTILLLIGIPIAAWLAFSRRWWRPLVEAVVALPIILPPTVMGYYILVMISPQNPVGSFYNTIFGEPLPFSFPGLVLASVLYSMPFAVQPFASAFRAVDREQVEAAWTLGASSVKTFRTVILPSSVYGVITGIVLSFAHTIGEFGVVLLVGGNIPGVTRVVSIDIYDNVQAMEYDAAGKTAMLLLVFSFVVLAVIYSLNRKNLSVWAGGK